MRRKRPFPSSSPHSAQAESRTIQNTTISSRTELVPTLGSANVEFLSMLTSQSNVTRASGGTPHAGQSSANTNGVLQSGPHRRNRGTGLGTDRGAAVSRRRSVECRTGPTRPSPGQCTNSLIRATLRAKQDSDIVALMPQPLRGRAQPSMALFVRSCSLLRILTSATR
jgi:hypothetical protein